MNYSIGKLNNFTKKTQFSGKNNVFFWKLTTEIHQILDKFCHFLKQNSEIPKKIHQVLASKWQISIQKDRKLNNSLFIFEKSWTIFN